MKISHAIWALLLSIFSFNLKAEEIPNYLVQSKKLDESRNKIGTSTGSSTYTIDQKAIGNLPQGSFTSFNQVLLQAPGVTQDSYGQIHIRNDHSNVQYRINGIIIPEGISGFGQSLDTHFIDKVTLLTGALPAQYGGRTGGVIEIQTKQGGFKNGGRTELTMGSYDTRNFNQELTGSRDRLSYYFNGNLLTNDKGIENPTAARNAIHDTTKQNREFGYFSYLLNAQTKLNAIVSNAVNNFQIPNNPGQDPAFQLNGLNSGDISSANLNQKQSETNRYAVLALQGVTDLDIDYQLSIFSRYSKVKYKTDYQGDLIFNGVASDINNSNINNGMQGDFSYKLADNHTLRSGIYLSHETAKSYRDTAVFETDINGNQASFDPFNILDSNQKTAKNYGYYLQDEWKAGDKLTINYGGRYDIWQGLARDQQFSPRVGTIYDFSKETKLHAGYSKYFTPPSSDLITTAALSKFQNTTNASENIINDPVKAEKTNYYDIGISHKLTSEINLGLDAYYKDIRNMLDKGQFGSALIYTPFNYDKAKAYGIEFTSDYHKDNFSVYFNLAYQQAKAKTITSGQYLFEQDELDYIANHWVNPDHSQNFTGSTGASYLFQSTTYNVNMLYGSGLRKGFANTEKLASYTQVNLGVSRDFILPIIEKFNARFSVNNVFDRIYQLRDGSGIGVGAPQYGARRGFYLTVSKSF